MFSSPHSPDDDHEEATTGHKNICVHSILVCLSFERKGTQTSDSSPGIFSDPHKKRWSVLQAKQGKKKSDSD